MVRQATRPGASAACHAAARKGILNKVRSGSSGGPGTELAPTISGGQGDTAINKPGRETATPRPSNRIAFANVSEMHHAMRKQRREMPGGDRSPENADPCANERYTDSPQELTQWAALATGSDDGGGHARTAVAAVGVTTTRVFKEMATYGRACIRAVTVGRSILEARDIVPQLMPNDIVTTNVGASTCGEIPRQSFELRLGGKQHG